jgi:putative aldouronate transport system permease protein
MMRSTGERVFSVINYGFFAIVGLIMVYPFWYVTMFALSGRIDLSSMYLWPLEPTLATFRRVISFGRVFDGYRNSLIVVGVGTAISMALTTLTAFPLSRKDMPYRRLFTGFVIFTMLFNGGMIPTYLVVRSYGLVNTLWALMLPQSVIVYNLLIMTRFFANIPDSLIEAAVIDGYNDFRILLSIVIPLSHAVLAAIALFYAVFYWNAFLPGLIYLNDAAKYPIQTYLYAMIKSSESTVEQGQDVIGALPESLKMATAFLTIVPILLVYPFLQKYFISGVMLGSVKG